MAAGGGVLALRTLSDRRAAWLAAAGFVGLAAALSVVVSASLLAAAAVLVGGLAATRSFPAPWAGPAAVAAAAGAGALHPSAGMAAAVVIASAVSHPAWAAATLGAGLIARGVVGATGGWGPVVIALGAGGVAWLAAHKLPPQGTIPRARTSDALVRSGGAAGILVLLLVDERLTLVAPDDLAGAWIAAGIAALVGAAGAMVLVGTLILRTVRDEARSLLFGGAVATLALAVQSTTSALVAILPLAALAGGAGAARMWDVYTPRLRAARARIPRWTPRRRPKRD